MLCRYDYRHLITWSTQQIVAEITTISAAACLHVTSVSSSRMEDFTTTQRLFATDAQVLRSIALLHESKVWGES